MSNENDRDNDGELASEDSDLFVRVAEINDRHARSGAVLPDGTLDVALYERRLEEALKC